MQTMSLNQIITVDPETMSGTPVFTGTRVPLKNLVDYILGGETLDKFLEDFPRVTHEQVTALLNLSFETVIALVNTHANPVG